MPFDIAPEPDPYRDTPSTFLAVALAIALLALAFAGCAAVAELLALLLGAGR